MPERPKIRIRPSPMTNGGVMIGSTDSTRSDFLYRNPVRVTINANASPSVVEITAQAFTGKSRVDRQRAVYQVLAEELAGPVHALALTANAPEK